MSAASETVNTLLTRLSWKGGSNCVAGICAEVAIAVRALQPLRASRRVAQSWSRCNDVSVIPRWGPVPYEQSTGWYGTPGISRGASRLIVNGKPDFNSFRLLAAPTSLSVRARESLRRAV
jgi:hypothetical protein